MTLIVKKFGGTSLATPSHIMHLANKIRDEINNGNKVVVIVSAMAKTTDELLSMAKQISPQPDKRELDMLLTTGERISMSLFSMALNSLGVKSYSYTGSQVGIITTSEHNNARILSIKGTRLIEALENNITPVIAGFQGVSSDKEITTLGRGGSDTTAVTIAAFLNADICEIYTDVDGVYTVDPRIVPNAKHIKNLSYKEMYVMASLGSKVLHPRSVEIAMKYNVKLYVKSSFNEGEGTMIENIETSNIVSISNKENLTIVNLKTQADLFDILDNILQKNLQFYYFMQKTGDSISFIIETEHVNNVLSCIEDLCDNVSINNDIAIISVIGNNIMSNKQTIKDIFNLTKKYKHDIYAITNAELSCSIVTKKQYSEKIIKDIANHFNLRNND